MPLTHLPAALVTLAARSAVLALACALPAQAAVGSGTPASCTEAALDLALAGGGAVSFDCGGGPVTIPITSTKVLWQSTHLDGGGLVTLQGDGNVRLFDLSGAANYTMANLTLRDGTALNGSGGAIRIETSTLLLENVTLYGNTASGAFARGGAIYSFSGAEVELRRVHATSNQATYGGAIATGGDTDRLTLTEFVAVDNHADSGGGVIVHAGAALTIAQSLFSANTASTFGASGGAIDVSPGVGSTLSITNSTFRGNVRIGGGGNGSAIAVTGVAAGTITNSTFADNGGAPGTIAVYGTSTPTRLTLANTIVTNMVGGSQPNCAVFGIGNAIDDGGHNLQWGGSVAQSCGAAIPEADPLLLALADNGGFSQTMALQAGSPAIDAGSGCPAVDQRGVARPAGVACDIGAYEAPSAAPPDNGGAQPVSVPTLGHAALALLGALVGGAGLRARRRGYS